MQKNRCFLFGAGDFCQLLENPLDRDLIIAADAGYQHLQNLKIEPDIVIGDFDSLDILPASPTVIRYPVMKDDTDMMLAVRLGFEKGCNTFFLYGGTGGKRMDHTVANFQTLAYIVNHGGEGYLIGKETIITAFTNETLYFSEKNIGIISVFCFSTSAEGVSIHGLKYELDHRVLLNDTPIGVSNSFVGKPSHITVENGMLFAMWNVKNGYPQCRRKEG